MLVGESRRLKDKAFVEFRGRELFLHGFSTLRVIYPDSFIICAESVAPKLKKYGMPFFSEDFDAGPLGGIFKAAQESTADYLFISAADMPFLNPDVIRFMQDKVDGRDCVIPVWPDGKLEPLHAFYNRESLLDVFSKGLPENKKVIVLMELLEKIERVPVDSLRAFDKDLRCFRNINTLEEFNSLGP